MVVSDAMDIQNFRSHVGIAKVIARSGCLLEVSKLWIVGVAGVEWCWDDQRVVSGLLR